MNKGFVCFTKSIDDDNVIGLIEELSLLCDKNDIDEIDLYFASSGGVVSSKLLLLNYLNGVTKKINFICCGECASAAFSLIMRIDSPNINITFLSSARFLIHRATMDISSYMVDVNNNYKLNDEIANSLLSNNDTILYEVIEHMNLTDDEINLIKSGYDVCIPYERINDCYTHYRNWRKYKSGKLDAEISEIDDKIKEYESQKEEYNRLYKKISNRERVYKYIPDVIRDKQL